MSSDRQDEQGRDRPDPYDSLRNIHKDVHGIRRQILDAIGSVEQSQTRMISTLTNILARIESKIDKLGAPSGGEVVTDADKTLMAASVVWLKAVVAKANALDKLTP